MKESCREIVCCLNDTRQMMQEGRQTDRQTDRQMTNTVSRNIKLPLLLFRLLLQKIYPQLLLLQELPSSS
jgi:hypothetical protein